MTDILRAGLIGCGSLGRTHSQALADLEGMKMVAFCDVRPEGAQALCDQFGGDYATTEARQVLEDPSLQAIYICTHHDTHAELCIAAAEQGKHLMVEKPLALTVEECIAVDRAITASGVKCFTAFKMRYYELINKAREIIPEPLLVTMQMTDNTWSPTMWANDPVKGGGNVLSQGCHSCDLLRYVAGRDPVEVYAAGGCYYTPTGVVDNLCATFRFEGGAAGSWVQGDANLQQPLSKFFMQVFAQGVSVALSERFCRLVVSRPGEEPEVHLGTETGFVEENRAFIDSLQNDTPPPIDQRDGLYATLMVLQAIASTRSGKPEPIKAVLP